MRGLENFVTAVTAPWLQCMAQTVVCCHTAILVLHEVAAAAKLFSVLAHGFDSSVVLQNKCGAPCRSALAVYGGERASLQPTNLRTLLAATHRITGVSVPAVQVFGLGQVSNLLHNAASIPTACCSEGHNDHLLYRHSEGSCQSSLCAPIGAAS